MQNAVRQRREDEVRDLGRDTIGHRPLRIEIAEGQFHQRVRTGDVRGGTLDHGDVGTALPERRTDVVSGVVRAEHEGLLAVIDFAAAMGAGMMNVTLERCGSGDLGDVRSTRHPRR